METIYQKYRPAQEILIEYYAYCELRKFIREDWEKEDNKWNNQCNKLWSEYEESSAKERDREENSKSTKIAKKLETMKLTEELVTKIKLRNRDK